MASHAPAQTEKGRPGDGGDYNTIPGRECIDNNHVYLFIKTEVITELESLISV